MKKCQVLSLDIPAKTLITVLGLECTPRTLRKARNGSTAARERVGWEDDYSITREQARELDQVAGTVIQDQKKKEVEQEFFRMIKTWQQFQHMERVDPCAKNVSATKKAKIEASRLVSRGKRLGLSLNVPKEVLSVDAALIKERRVTT